MRQSEQQLGIASRSPCPLIGQDNCGRWVVLDRQGHCGGLFASSKEAIHFAMFKSERRPQAAIMAAPNWRWVTDIKPGARRRGIEPIGRGALRDLLAALLQRLARLWNSP
jgi:hypothetical protein